MSQLRMIRGLVLACAVTSTMLADPELGPLAMRHRLQSISKAVVDLTAGTDLLRNKDFLEIYNHPKQSAVLEALDDRALNEQEKMIAVLSIQKISLPDYVSFLKQVAELRQQQRISDAIFRVAYFPGHVWSTKLEENYKNPQVIALLESVQASGLLNSNQRVWIANILSGKAEREHRRFAKDQEKMSRLKEWGK